jgi:hypothetical protein
MLSLGHLFAALAATVIFPATVRADDLLYCGNKYCGIDAVCNSNNKCECPLSSPMGDPAFRCHPDNIVSCVLIGDPSLTGFSGDLTFMDFPCKYTLSKFDTPLLSRKHNNDPPSSWGLADPGRDRCRVIVQGTNAVTPKGTYYLKEVEILVTINVGGSSQMETLIVGLGAEQASYSYPPNPEVFVEKDDEHGCISRIMDTADSIGLSLCFLKESNIWSFGVSICGGTYVNFRPWQGEDENQPMRPGAFVSTNGETALFENNANGYPNTMCDSPFNDADDVYHDTCKKLGIVGKRNCALYAFLVSNPPEQPHYCMASIELFNICTPEDKVKATNACGSIVTQLAKCVLKNDQSVLNVFEACVVAVCGDPTLCKSIASNVHHGDEEDCNSFPHPC